MINVYAIGHRQHARQNFLALFLFFSIFFFSFYSGNSISKGISAVTVPTATPMPNASNDLFSLELDRYTITHPCPLSYRCVEQGDKDSSVAVTVSGNRPENDELRYKYTTSGGRVIGEGAKVRWDLTGGQPGTYTITVAIEDESGNELQLITKTISVFGYQDDSDRCLVCPELSVDAPTSPTQAGETMTFTANIQSNAETITYNWTVTNGKIIEGQGTPTIKVATNPKMAGKVVEATAKFNWDIICSEICNSTASASGLVAVKKRKGK